MRNFESFLTRRKIKDFRGWCSRLKIESFQQFKAYCTSQELSFEEEKYAAIFSASSLEELEPPKEEVEVSGSSDKSWHVPAAERPIKSRRTTRKAPAKKVNPKPKAKPRVRKTKKD